MEFALASHIKTYSGGLGVLAGDYIKGRGMRDYPWSVWGLVEAGYTSQTLDASGKVVDSFKNYDYESILSDTGKTVKVTIRRRMPKSGG